MKIPTFLFLLCIALCGVVIAACLIGEEPFEDKPAGDGGDPVRTYLGHGLSHPEFKTMLIGGPGAPRHSRILWLGWIFGAIEIAFFVGCLALGASRGGRVGPYARPLIIGAAIYLLVFTLLILSYRTYMTEQSHALVLFQPKPTAWMVYGIWGFPVFFIFLYFLSFDRWFVTDEDLKRLNEIVGRNTPTEQEEA